MNAASTTTARPSESAAIRPTPVVRESEATRFVESATSAGQYYRVTATSCTCKGFAFRSHCRHIAAAFPVFCSHCGTEPVKVAGTNCIGCEAVLIARNAPVASRYDDEDDAGYYRPSHYSQAAWR